MQGLPVSFVAIIQEVTGESCFFIYAWKESLSPT